MITPSFGLTATERVLPKLALDFTTASLDSRITFTRTTGASNPATYVNSSGVIIAATNNQPRFDYDPVTLACKGLLIEESRTNLVAASQQAFNNTTYWAKTGGVTVSDSSVASPEGINTASVATGVNSVTTYLTSAQMTISASTNYAVSLFIKAGTSVNSRFRIYNGAVSVEFAGVVILWTAGVPSTSSTSGTWVTAPTYTSFGNGWYRVTGVFASGTQTNAKILVYPDQNSVGANTQIYGAQLEAGAFATSYIPTTTTALTRNADVATMTGTNFSNWYNAGAGAFNCAVLPKSATGTKPVLQFDDATALNTIAMQGNATAVELKITTLAVLQSTLSTGTITANTAYGSCSALTAGSNALSKSGGVATTGSPVSIPTVTQSRLGSDGTNYFNGWLQKINYWPQRLTNSEVQAFSK